jgi:hypothetical protein
MTPPPISSAARVTRSTAVNPYLPGRTGGSDVTRVAPVWQPAALYEQVWNMHCRLPRSGSAADSTPPPPSGIPPWVWCSYPHKHVALDLMGCEHSTSSTTFRSNILLPCYCGYFSVAVKIHDMTLWAVMLHVTCLASCT